MRSSAVGTSLEEAGTLRKVRKVEGSFWDGEFREETPIDWSRKLSNQNGMIVHYRCTWWCQESRTLMPSFVADSSFFIDFFRPCLFWNAFSLLSDCMILLQGWSHWISWKLRTKSMRIKRGRWVCSPPIELVFSPFRFLPSVSSLWNWHLWFLFPFFLIHRIRCSSMWKQRTVPFSDLFRMAEIYNLFLMVVCVYRYVCCNCMIMLANSSSELSVSSILR